MEHVSDSTEINYLYFLKFSSVQNGEEYSDRAAEKSKFW